MHCELTTFAGAGDSAAQSDKHRIEGGNVRVRKCILGDDDGELRVIGLLTSYAEGSLGIEWSDAYTAATDPRAYLAGPFNVQATGATGYAVSDERGTELAGFKSDLSKIMHPTAAGYEHVGCRLREEHTVTVTSPPRRLKPLTSWSILNEDWGRVVICAPPLVT